MSEAKYTKGKWKWWTSNSWKRLMSEHDGQTISVITPHVCRDGHPDINVSEADMKLIEAAPDLYEAAKKVSEHLDERYIYGLAELNDAIKKANP